MEEQWKIYKTSYYFHSTKINQQYEISNLGRYRVNGVIKEPILNNAGYYMIKGGLLHRIVALNFIDNVDNKPCVDHIDGNKLNNRADNLRWVTHKENNNNPITKEKMINGLREYMNSDRYRVPFKGKHHTEESKHKLSEAKKGKPRKTPIWNKGLTGWMSEETKNKRLNSYLQTIKNRTEDQKHLISEACSTRMQGNNIVKGRIHINNGIESKMIYPDDLEWYENQGYKKGRLFNK